MSQGEAAGSASDDLAARLRSFEGLPVGPPVRALDPVNVPMIRHFVEAVGDDNPVYLDDSAARAHGREGVVAPPAMLQAWTMRGLKRHLEALAARKGAGGPSGPQDELIVLLAAAGFGSVVATNCEQTYLREVGEGTVLTSESVIESVSPEKKTALGPGHFLTNVTRYLDQDGELVATMRFRILLYRPADRAGGVGGAVGGGGGRRPRPIVTHDSAPYFEGLERGELLVQRCSKCQLPRHPPRPGCARCGSLESEFVPASGRGVLHSYVVAHHPEMPGFDFPLVIGLVELEEGTRIVAELRGTAPSEVAIGTALRAEITRIDDSLVLPVFVPELRNVEPSEPLSPSGSGEAVSQSGPVDPVSPSWHVEPREPGTRSGSAHIEGEVRVGDVIPPLEVEITRTLVVAGALATRDYQDVHHDPELARANGAPDVFMNILTTNGFVGRFVTDWSGPDAVLESISIRLGAPNYPGDTMRLTGRVARVDSVGERRTVEVDVAGANRLGAHVTGKVRLNVPGGAR